jgi:serine/threonine protein kinase
MDPAVGLAGSSVVFEDPLGQRRPSADPNGADTLELLCLRSELTAVSSFEFALRERVARLANFRHAYYARVRGVERLKGGSTLALVSERTPGVRLSEVLKNVEQENIRLDINSALSLIRQMVPAIALLHENVRDVAHGAIGPERLVLTPNARMVIVEHVLGAALEQLRYSPERYWQDLRVPVPRMTGASRFDHRTDIMQVGIVALELVLGRRLRADEYPTRTAEVVASAWAISSTGGLEPLPAGLRSWLMRALQLDPRNSFASALDARAELDKMVSGGDYIAAPQALETFIAEYQAVCESDESVSSDESESEDDQRAPTKVPSYQSSEIVPPAKQKAEVIIPPPPTPYLDEFDTAEEEGEEEDEDEAPRDTAMPKNSAQRRQLGLAAVAIAALVVVVAGGVFAGRRYFAAAAVEATGAMSIDSNPTGAQVFVDSESRGVTPINLTLKAGTHVIELRGAGEPRMIPVTVAPGSQSSQYIELPKETVVLGQLQVRTDPAAAQVTVDGVPRGRSPLTIADLTPGPHTVVLENELGSVKQEVTIESGATASLVVPLTAAPGAPVSGWISVTAPVLMQIFENGRLLGSTESDRIMVSAGKHDIEISSEPLGFRVIRNLQVVPGKVVPIKIDLPKQKIAINAVPWAEVWIDGERIGETPIGDYTVLAGPHELTFRHPEFGEQKHALTVTVNAPARVSVDMRKK